MSDDKGPWLGMNSFVVFFGLIFAAPMGAVLGYAVGEGGNFPGHGWVGAVIGGVLAYCFVWFTFSGEDPSA